MDEPDRTSHEDVRRLSLVSRHAEVAELFGYATRRDERSLAAAERLSTIVGEPVPVVGRYLEALSKLPSEHLLILEHRGCRIVFAPTIVDGIDSEVAAERRGRVLSQGERWDLELHRSQRAGTIAIYDPALDVIVFPTTYASPDFDHVAHHEIGHALTMREADPRASLLENLPDEMREQIREGSPSGAGSQETLRHEVIEALAEGYTYLAGGQANLVPSALRKEIQLMIELERHADRLRFRFEEGT